ncbi:MAG: exo-alpha-sialidase [Chthoniobacterales bacterium]
MSSDFHVDLQVLSSGYDRKTCWVHPRPAFLPKSSQAIVTAQKLRLSGDDVFHGIYDFFSEDGGEHWTEPRLQTNFTRRPFQKSMEEGICDLSPGWHEKSQTLLVTGHTVLYQNDELAPAPRLRQTAYSTWDAATGMWREWQKLDLSDQKLFAYEGAGSVQRLDLLNGDILLPTYYGIPDATDENADLTYAVRVLRCSFDGRQLSCLEYGSELSLSNERGFVEPSIACVGKRYFLTLRNDLAGYVTTSTDGLHYETPRPWLFDDGADLGNYNTQQHWVTHGDDLFLIYTRRGADNDHIMRHRAPLFIAQVDTKRLCVKRETERILVPERGARLGNFGVCKVSEKETWVTVAEWMQTIAPDPFDCTVCEKYGSDNSVFLAKILF